MNFRKHTSRKTFFLLSLLLAVSFSLLTMGMLPWPKANCQQYDLNIHSGRIRYTRYFGFIAVKQRIDDSALAVALQSEIHADQESDWLSAATIVVGKQWRSPRYARSVLLQLRDLEMIWKVGQFTAMARQISARKFLESWQATGSEGVEQFLQKMWVVAFASQSQSGITDGKDLMP